MAAEDVGPTDIVTLNADKGTITIRLDGDEEATGCQDDESINVDNVLLNLVGSGATTVAATVTSTGDVRLGGANGNRLTVIDSVVDPLTDDGVNVGQKLTLIRHTGKPAVAAKNEFHLVITEAHVDSFTGAQLELSFSGIPEDVELIALDAWVTTKKLHDEDPMKTADRGNQISIGARGSMTTTADDDDEVVVYFTAAGFPEVPEDGTTTAIEFLAADTGGSLVATAVDVVVVRGKIKGADDDDLLPIDLAIDVTVDLGPTGDDDDFNAMNRPVVFDSDKTTAVTVIESTPSRTTLMVPFVTNDGTFETGIAVSNMSSGASAQPGAVMFDFYVGGTKMSHKTSASSEGTGLNESGMLEPGNTWSVLLSQVFPGNPGNGYMTITTDFTDGDANVFISDFDGFSVTGTVRAVH